MTEKKLLLKDAKKCLDILKNNKVELKNTIIAKKDEIDIIKETYQNIKRDNTQFQAIIDKLQLQQMIVTLNEIETLKDDIGETSQVEHVQLAAIMNDLISVENNIETSIEQKDEELRRSAEISKEPENRLYELMNEVEGLFDLSIRFLEGEVKKEGPGTPSLCADGRLGKALLSCGHYLCSKCFFEQSSKDKKLISCAACGGISQDIVHVIMSCGCKRVPVKELKFPYSSDRSCKTLQSFSNTAPKLYRLQSKA